MKKAVLGLYAVSQIHAGAGSDTGIVDLPIQRERITGYPIIRGVKGAFRHQVKLDKNTIKDIFGPEQSESSDHAGAISFSEARILLFPVRGLKEPFYYVTCPQVLKRFRRDSEMEFDIPQFENNDESYIYGGNNEDIHLEGIKIHTKEWSDDGLWNAIKGLIPSDFADDVKKRLVIVSDELFGYLVRTTTEVVPRIKIDEEKGTVKQGALWYEEYLPMDSVMYVVLRDRELGRAKYKNLMEVLVKAIDGKTITLGGKVGVGGGFMVVKAVKDVNTQSE